MIPNVNTEEVKKFNLALKEYKDRAVRINAEIEFLSKEIDTLCAELSTEVGVQVTRDNIETVCKDLADKINSSLQSGNVVLAKIADVEQSEQSKAELGGTAEVVQTVPVQPVAQVGQPAVQVGQPAGFNMSAVDMNGIASQANANTINWNN